MAFQQKCDDTEIVRRYVWIIDRSRNSLPVCVPGIITSSPSQSPAQTDVEIVETPGKNHYIVGTANGVD